MLAEYMRALAGAGLSIDTVLAPLRSPINLAPQSKQSVQREIARRLTRGSARLTSLFATILAIPGVWPLLLPMLERIDHRPGRHYSFVAHRP